MNNDTTPTAENTGKHTPTPWTTDGKTIYAGLKTEGRPNGIESVAIMNQGGIAPVGGESKANAQLIVTAVNSYSQLKEENAALQTEQSRLLARVGLMTDSLNVRIQQIIELQSDNEAKQKRIEELEWFVNNTKHVFHNGGYEMKAAKAEELLTPKQ